MLPRQPITIVASLPIYGGCPIGAQLLGVSRCLLLSRGALEMGQAKAQVLSAAAAGGVTVADISPLGEHMLKVGLFPYLHLFFHAS